MHPIQQCIYHLTEHEQSLVKSLCKKKEITKGTLLLRPGHICRSIYYIEQGAFVQYSLSDEQDKNIIDLHAAGTWMLNQQSFMQQIASDTYIEAYTISTVYELSLYHIHYLIEQSTKFLQIGKLLEPSILRAQFFDKSMSPKQKYDYLFQHHRGLLQVFPLKIIASFLKISPETLSRLRRQP